MAETIASRKQRLVVGACIVAVALSFAAWRKYQKNDAQKSMGEECSVAEECASGVCVMPANTQGLQEGPGLCSRRCNSDHQCTRRGWKCLPVNEDEESRRVCTQSP